MWIAGLIRTTKKIYFSSMQMRSARSYYFVAFPDQSGSARPPLCLRRPEICIVTGS
jgi:hypothetical protein